MVLPRATAIIAAAGSGRRFVRAAGVDHGMPKVFADLAGRPVVAHVLEAFGQVPAVVEMVMAVPEDRLSWARETLDGFGREGCRLTYVAGGAERADSVARALDVADRSTELVAIHDGARPLIRPAVIEEALRVAVECGAAVVGRPVDHTVKTVADDGSVIETVPRRALWLAQTPQVFRREVLAQAYARRKDVVGRVTDDSQLVEALGQTVRMVQGDASNLKVTTPEDLRACEVLLAAGWPFEP